MTLDDWIKYFDGDMDAVNAVYCLQNYKPYTDEEIKDAIEKIEKVAIGCGVSRMEIINILLYNETMKLK